VGPVTAKNLVSYCGGAEAVFRAARKDLLRIPGIGPGTAGALRSPEPLRLAERELAFMERHGVRALFYTDPGYPVRLRQNHDCPALLYFKGSSERLLDANRVIAIVGTRQPTDYGRMLCEEIVEGLLPYDIVLLSGLAFGIDIVAHRQATALGIPNIGVLGHGLGTIYPSQHRGTALKMIENGGLLSEYPHDTKPDREHFPMRNRIVTGMCDALIVVESAASGGSLISAELAVQYGRELFAVPGRVRDPKSAGCNYLIKSGRARLAESASDIADALRWEEPGREKGRQAQLFPDLTDAESGLVDLIRQSPEIAIDQLSAAARLPAGDLAAQLLNLEFKGVIRTLPGKRYIVCG
jgi:DNA processing protein